MDIHEVVKKLVGKIQPVGKTNEDNQRFENLKVLTALVDKLLTDIDNVAMEKDRHKYSRSRAGKFASEFFAHIGITE